jgi:hypothetical protein
MAARPRHGRTAAFAGMVTLVALRLDGQRRFGSRIPKYQVVKPMRCTVNSGHFRFKPPGDKSKALDNRS